MDVKTQVPITFLHAEQVMVQAVSEQEMGFAQENDTLNTASGDSDTN